MNTIYEIYMIYLNQILDIFLCGPGLDTELRCILFLSFACEAFESKVLFTLIKYMGHK